jgi:hypothetical protein
VGATVEYMGISAYTNILMRADTTMNVMSYYTMGTQWVSVGPNNYQSGEIVAYIGWWGQNPQKAKNPDIGLVTGKGAYMGLQTLFLFERPTPVNPTKNACRTDLSKIPRNFSSIPRSRCEKIYKVDVITKEAHARWASLLL